MKKKEEKLKIQKLVWILKGFILGWGMIVPGLSVGTLELVMNMYFWYGCSLLHQILVYNVEID